MFYEVLISPLKSDIANIFKNFISHEFCKMNQLIGNDDFKHLINNTHFRKVYIY
jgi:hypothetical protein